MGYWTFERGTVARCTVAEEVEGKQVSQASSKDVEGSEYLSSLEIGFKFQFKGKKPIAESTSHLKDQTVT